MSGQPDNGELVMAVREDFNRLRGRLFGVVEAVGFPEQQELAVKKLIRQVTYDSQTDLESLLRGGA